MEDILTDEERDSYNYGKYPVTIIEHFKIQLSPEISLAAKIWFPDEVMSEIEFKDCNTFLFCKKRPDCLENCPEGLFEKFSVILEYLPYRKSDLTAQEDHGKYSWLASYGYVCMRVDIRGTGDSDGILNDEYSQEEQDDCLELLKWLEKQPWCTGKVAMMGISWGGFNGLQMAYLQPPQLRTVISLCSTDDRYATDVHFDGGCLTGDSMISWATLILAWNALPPDPRHVLHWKDMWKKRLDAAKPWMTNWLKHQTRDNYWKHGSICQNYSRVKCPVLLMGGWKDPYRDAIFRMLENLPNVKAIIGPWGHSWPHTCIPGPNIDFLKICLSWFDHTLKNIDNAIDNEPKLKAYLQNYVIPSEDPLVFVPGKWIQFDKWPLCKSNHQRWIPYNNKLEVHQNDSLEFEIKTKWDQIPFVENYGIQYCLWVEMSRSKSPYDHSKNKCPALTYMSDPLEKDFVVFGNPEFVCTIRLNDCKSGLLQVQLLNVDCEDRSSMISYGVKKVTIKDGTHKNNQPIPVKVQLHAVSIIVPKGHRLSLQISPNFWPSVWCNDSKVSMSILTGIDESNLPISMLAIPTLNERDIQLYNHETFNTKTPAKGKDMSAEEYKPSSISMQISYDPIKQVHKRLIENYYGTVYLNQQDVLIENHSKEECLISEGETTNPYSESEMISILHYKNVKEIGKQNCTKEVIEKEVHNSLYKDTEANDTNDINDNTRNTTAYNSNSDSMMVKVVAKTCLSTVDNSYHLQSHLKVSCDNIEVCSKTWDDEVKIHKET